jgi:ABC-type antimicrobial peptide transport system permease subunit
MVMREAITVTSFGLAIGLGGALIAGQLLRSFLFGIGPTDGWTLACVCAVLGIAAGLASVLPALRAMRVSPLAALRAE